MFVTKEDASVFAKLSIESIKKYQHKIYRLSAFNDEKDFLYAKSINPQFVERIIDFLQRFNYENFKKFDEIEKETIFNEIMNLYKNLIFDSDNLRIKYIKKHFRK